MASREHDITAWQPIETAPDDKAHRRYIVSDGRYLKKVTWDKKMACWTEAIQGCDPRPIDPPPTHWFADGDDTARLFPLPK
jgi:hypothetical protein